MKTTGTTYPDSVSLVSPPNITIPKTLAALARSQYATLLLLVLGKLDVRALAWTAASAMEAWGPLLAVAEDWKRIHCAMDGGRKADIRGGVGIEERKGELKHGRGTNTLRAILGAAALH